MSPTDEGLSSGPEMAIVLRVNGVGLDEESGLGAERAFFERDG